MRHLKISRFLYIIFSFLFLLGTYQAFSMDDLDADTCNVCKDMKKNKGNLYILEEMFSVEPKKVCSFKCAKNYLSKSKYAINPDDYKCAACKIEVKSNFVIFQCGHILCENCIINQKKLESFKCIFCNKETEFMFKMVDKNKMDEFELRKYSFICRETAFILAALRKKGDKIKITESAKFELEKLGIDSFGSTANLAYNFGVVTPVRKYLLKRLNGITAYIRVIRVMIDKCDEIRLLNLPLEGFILSCGNKAIRLVNDFEDGPDSFRISEINCELFQ